MKKINNIKQNEFLGKEDKKFALERVDTEINELVVLLKELAKKASSLPTVEKDGSSECPYAEDMYAEKDDLTEKVKKKYKELKKLNILIDRLKDRNGKNLDIIRSDRKSINNKSAIDEYSSAMQSEKHRYEIISEKQKRLGQVLEWAEDITYIAMAKQYPGKKPVKKCSPPMNLTGGIPRKGINGISDQTTNTPISPNPSISTPINGLTALGPIGGNKF